MEDWKEKYEDLIERLRKAKEGDSCDDRFCCVIDDVVPELKESEDEKVRKTLIDYFKNYKTQEDIGIKTFFGIPTDDIIAWLEKQKTSEEALQYLIENHSSSEMSDFQAAMNIAVAKAYDKGYNDGLEKQGEQKPVVIIPKFRIGDNIKTTNEESLTITKIDEKGYWSEDLFICGFDEECIWDLVEQKPIISNDALREGIAQFGITQYQIDNWLKKYVSVEKQGEPIDKVEPKFKVGDIVKHKKNPHLTYILKRFTDDGDYEFHAIGKDGTEGGTCFAVVKYQDDWELAEQKPTDKVEPKFHEGDWIVDKQGIVHQIANVVENVTNHTYGYDIVGGGYFNDNTEGVRLWTIQDAKAR